MFLLSLPLIPCYLLTWSRNCSSLWVPYEFSSLFFPKKFPYTFPSFFPYHLLFITSHRTPLKSQSETAPSDPKSTHRFCVKKICPSFPVKPLLVRIWVVYSFFLHIFLSKGTTYLHATHYYFASLFSLQTLKWRWDSALLSTEKLRLWKNTEARHGTKNIWTI